MAKVSYEHKPEMYDSMASKYPEHDVPSELLPESARPGDKHHVHCECEVVSIGTKISRIRLLNGEHGGKVEEKEEKPNQA